MGVPALFRWLSKKYPKIVSRVIEDTPTKVRNGDGEVVEVPVRFESANPNGFEVDNLYLDMNGIVHPCTHPEGKPAPETEEDMMVEIFKYTERVVNMARPRKVLMMAIDGVAPRAKMNQQRSRRFRAAQEAADKEEERREAIKLFEAMGHPVSEETKSQKGWDTNAITPGTPFMDLLSISLKYWTSYKLTSDPGWRDLKVILSDSSVPGEGEHKIMDWIRRQRSYPNWDPNTSHVIYGLDADLIMLSLATHEPRFRVLREDVFFQGSKDSQACRNCGEVGHFSANCKGEKKVKDPNVVEKAKPVDPKPFIFLDVSVLREYLAVELVVPGVPFQFSLELAIDDWIFMIFFVGNDFLPHLPSLEIREGAIDALLKIWRAELPRMGGYLTNHGKVHLQRAQVILEGLAKNEDDIFARRKEDEERQDQNSKRRRIEDHRRQDEAKARKGNGSNGSTVLNGQEYVAVTPAATARGGPLHPSLPQRPGFDLVPKAEVERVAAAAVVPPRKMNKQEREAESMRVGLEALQGSNEDIVKNRKAIRLANLSAAEALRAELEGHVKPAQSSVKEENGEVARSDGAAKMEETVVLERSEDEEQVEMTIEQAKEALEEQGEGNGVDEEVVEPGLRQASEDGQPEVDRPGDEPMEDDEAVDGDVDGSDPTNPPSWASYAEASEVDGSRRQRKGRGKKRRFEEEEEEDEGGSDAEAPPNPEADQPLSKKTLKVNPDGTVEGYVDDVRLWEPGYRERYYRQKFGVELSDNGFIDRVTRHYMEGLCWVLEYYYQGVPAWDWFYPFHFAPFAQDFRNVDKMRIEFEVAEPFKPYGQLLGVFPAASRIHLPLPLQSLMIDEESPIIDFYPDDFEIDMNGKKMAWQGVALLPFIDQTRLLDALHSKEEMLTEDEKRRNRWGDNVMFVSERSRLYEPFCGLYTLQAGGKPLPIDTGLSQGMSGAVLADPACVPNSGLDSPLPSIEECPDLSTNASISARYYFPRQAHKHRSVLLSGYRPGPAALGESDKDWVRRGAGGGGGRGGERGSRSDRGDRNGPRHSGGPGVARSGNGYGGGGGGSGYGSPAPGAGGGYGGRGYAQPPSQAGYGYAPPAPVAAYNGGGYGGSAGAGSYGRSLGGTPFSSNPYAPPLSAYGAPISGGYGAPSPYSSYAPPPPNSYAPAASGGNGGRGATPGGYGGHGGYGEGRGGTGRSAQYGGNPYAPSAQGRGGQHTRF